jgi:hypothetical protein
MRLPCCIFNVLLKKKIDEKFSKSNIAQFFKSGNDSICSLNSEKEVLGYIIFLA